MFRVVLDTTVDTSRTKQEQQRSKLGPSTEALTETSGFNRCTGLRVTSSPGVGVQQISPVLP